MFQRFGFKKSTTKVEKYLLVKEKFEFWWTFDLEILSKLLFTLKKEIEDLEINRKKSNIEFVLFNILTYEIVKS